MKNHIIIMSDQEVDLLIKNLEYSLIELNRQGKKLGQSDFDLKECYWQYRYNANVLRKKLLSLKYS